MNYEIIPGEGELNTGALETEISKLHVHVYIKLLTLGGYIRYTI